MRSLDLEPPSYAHLPVIMDARGAKLAKQHGTPPVDSGDPARNLRQALQWLQLHPPAALRGVEPLLRWAVAHWSLAALGTSNLTLR